MLQQPSVEEFPTALGGSVSGVLCCSGHRQSSRYLIRATSTRELVVMVTACGTGLVTESSTIILVPARKGAGRE